MKIELLKEHLEAASQITSRVSNKNLLLPVLGCVVIEAIGDRVVVKATNLDISVEMVVKAKVLESGVVAVPAHTFHQLITTETGQKITLTTKDSILEVVGGHGTSKLKTIEVDEFPTLPYVKEGEGYTISLHAKEITHALKSVSFAASVSGIRPELSSVFMKIDSGVVTAAATDSFRLAEIKLPTSSKKTADPILIPARNIQEILRVIGGSDAVEVRVGENQMTVFAGGGFITSRIIDGAFPDYNAIIPKNFITSATALTEDVVRALRKVSVFTDATGQIELTVNTEGKSIAFKAVNVSVGEIREELDGAIDGENTTLFFNVKYILEALSVVSSDSVVFKFSGSGKPLIIKEVPDKGFTYLVMPMNK